jgi:hypothetical protein
MLRKIEKGSQASSLASLVTTMLESDDLAHCWHITTEAIPFSVVDHESLSFEHGE